MSQKIIKIGSSLGVTLPKSVLQKAELKKGSDVVVSFNDRKQSIEIQPVVDELELELTKQALQLVAKHKNELSKINGSD